MSKKLFLLSLTVILSVSMVFGGITCLAEELVECEILHSGHMEWHGTSYAQWSNASISTEISNTDEKSVYLTSTKEKPKAAAEYWSYLKPREQYTLTFYLYEAEGFVRTDENHHAGVYFKYVKDGREIGEGYDYVDCKKLSPSLSPETWTKYTVEYTARDAEYDSVRIFLFSYGIGTTYFDDVTLTGMYPPAEANEIKELGQRLEEGYEIHKKYVDEQNNHIETSSLFGNNFLAKNSNDNPGFEFGLNDYNWKPQSTTGLEIVRTTNDKHTSSYSLRFSVSDAYTSNSSPYAYQRISGTFDFGAEYIATAWVKTVNGDASIDVKAYDSARQAIFSSSSTFNTNNTWKQCKLPFEMKEDIAYLELYLRCSSSAGTEVYFDDVEFGYSKDNKPLKLKPDHTFNYADEKTITAKTTFNKIAYPIAPRSKIRYSVLDENGVTVISPYEIDAEEKTEWTFSSESLKKKTKYILQAEYIDENGVQKEEWTQTKNIYLYDRPMALDKNGNLHDLELVNGELKPNNKIVPPVFVYKKPTYDYASVGAAGVTVIAQDVSELTPEYLETLYSNGIRVLVDLYGDEPAGHPKNIENTKKIVEEFKDHPAIAAYMLMDEPTKHVSQKGIRTYEEMLYCLEEGYKAIREIDDVHPVFVMESRNEYADGYERTSQMCDIFAIDPYPSSLDAEMKGYIEKCTKQAVAAVNDERPVWSLCLTAYGSNWPGDYGNPENYGSAMIRYQLYDALWAGAKGAGHYLEKDIKLDLKGFLERETKPADDVLDLNAIFTNAPEKVIDGTTYKANYGILYDESKEILYKEINGILYENDTPYEKIYFDVMADAKAKGEIDEIFDHFTLDKPEFNEGSDTVNGYQWRAWYNDNGDMLVAVRSKLSSGSANANFALVSKDGTTPINGFTATLVNGASTAEKTVTSTTNDFKCTITAGEVSLYKITKGYTLSKLTTSSTGTSVTVECDVTNNLTASGTVIYSFYDEDGRLLTMKTAAAPSVGGTTHITKTIDEKFDFAKIKVFIWNTLGGLIPYSNVLEN